jgi:hypothetical protein
MSVVTCPILAGPEIHQYDLPRVRNVDLQSVTVAAQEVMV